MNGRELWERVQLLRPKIKALFMSGYASDVLTGRGILAQEADFIEKPFSFKGLAGKVREVLDKG